MNWWSDNKLRMVQFNLMQEDAAVDTQRLTAQLKDYHANAVMIGAGGIVAYYPTLLPFQYRSPYLGDRDMLGTLVNHCHENNIRVIARFDFSKLHESIALAHPEWLYHERNGQVVNYHGMVHTCLSGAYQWERSLDILRECLGRYPVDGLYINMFGYHTMDYSGVDHGICHCEQCRKLFREETGMELPEGKESPSMAAYTAFKSKRVLAMTQRVRETVKAIRGDISLCTHTTELCVDMTHSESNTSLARPLPLWQYPSFDNVRLTNDQRNDIVSANCVINAADIFWRFMGVSRHLNNLRLWQNMAAGGQLEWCIVGTPDHYPETENDEGVREIFAFHERNERFFGRRQSLAKIAVVRPTDEAFSPEDGRMDEYRGIVRMLKEGHREFDVLTPRSLVRLAGQYQLLILPQTAVDAALIPPQCAVLATGSAWRDEPETLSSLFDAKLVRTEVNTKGAYLLCEDKQLFKRIPRRNWILLDGEIDLMEGGEGALPYMAPGVYGPVEIAGGVFPSGYHAVLLKRDAGRVNALLPWQAGRLYWKYGYMEHRDIILDLIDELIGPNEVETNAPDKVELYYDRCEGGRRLQLINLTGLDGVTAHAPVPVHDLCVSLPALDTPFALDLRTGKKLPVERTAETLSLHLPPLDEYTAVFLPDAGTSC